jgi:hypothetical protein
VNVDSKKANNGSREQAAVGRHASATEKLEFCAKTKSQQMHVHQSTSSIRQEEITQTSMKQ